MDSQSDQIVNHLLALMDFCSDPILNLSPRERVDLLNHLGMASILLIKGLRPTFSKEG